MTRVFVTGADGFLGSHVVRELLCSGYDVTALVGPEGTAGDLEALDVRCRPLDLREPEGVRRALEGGELLVHSAGRYRFWDADPERLYRVNVYGTQAVLAAAAEHGYRKVVYTSSAATLTPSLNRQVESEESLYDLRRFHGHYKCSKVLAEMVALRRAAQGLPVVVVNPTAVVGAGDRRPTPTGGMIVHYLNGRMKVYLEATLNIADVDDVARGHVLALESGTPGHQYVLGGENLSMSHVTRMLAELTGIPPPRFALPPQLLLGLGHVQEWLARNVTKRPPLVPVESVLHATSGRASDSSKATKELGYRPSRARPALAKAAAWYAENGYCKRRFRERIEAHGVLRRALEDPGSQHGVQDAGAASTSPSA